MITLLDAILYALRTAWGIISCRLSTPCLAELSVSCRLSTTCLGWVVGDVSHVSRCWLFHNAQADSSINMVATESVQSCWMSLFISYKHSLTSSLFDRMQHDNQALRNAPKMHRPHAKRRRATSKWQWRLIDKLNLIYGPELYRESHSRSLEKTILGYRCWAL